MDGARDPSVTRGDEERVVTLLELVARVPQFQYRVDALRVDGTQSADPADYADYPVSGIVGAELHAFVTAELDRRLAPALVEGEGSDDRVVRWPLEDALLLARAPTVADLRRWSRVERLVPDGRGSFRPA